MLLLLQSHSAVESFHPNSQNVPVSHGEGEYLFSLLAMTILPLISNRLPSTKLLTTTAHKWLFFRVSTLVPLEMLKPTKAAGTVATLQRLAFLPTPAIRVWTRADWLSNRCIALHLLKVLLKFQVCLVPLVPQSRTRCVECGDRIGETG